MKVKLNFSSKINFVCSTFKNFFLSFPNRKFSNVPNGSQSAWTNYNISNLSTQSNNKTEFEYRVFLYKDQDNIHKASFWHDIPYYNKEDYTYNTIIEIPRGTVSKLEMSKETFNPIKQDTQKNKITGADYLRYYKLTPVFNYGFIPRTWENNKIKSIDNCYGDNDPLDVIELSNNKRFFTGQIIRVHIVGCFCLIDQDEVDWKILAVDSAIIAGKEAESYLKDPKNMERVREIQNWFKIYKTFEGKKENRLYKDGEIFNIEVTKKIIEENHRFYMDLISCKN